MTSDYLYGLALTYYCQKSLAEVILAERKSESNYLNR